MSVPQAPLSAKTPALPASTATPTPAATPAFNGTFTCEHCQKPTQFLGISRAMRLLTVSRSTIYYWMDRGWIHWRLLPSGRRVICMESLSSSSKPSAAGGRALKVGAANS